jgi:tryptophan-rich sensory protein
MQFIRLVVSLALPFLAGMIGSLFTMPSILTWYAGLHKPFFNPPNWIFGPVWTILYVMMGIAVFLIWEKRRAQTKTVDLALGLFALQLLLNTSWSIVFFGWHQIGLGLVNIVLLWLAILLCIIRFYPISRLAAWLLGPYIVWVSFAAVLNFAIMVLN